MAGVRLSQELFLERCLSHLCSKNYDFTNTKYTNSRTSVDIQCKIHGRFSCNPTVIMNGHGCRICDKLKGCSSELTLDQYKIVASQFHNNKYDYSLVDLKNEKIKVICPEHGEFLIRKSAHISPTQLYGCQKCGNIRSIGEERIIKYLESHDIRYDYQKTFDWSWSVGRKQPLRYDFYLSEMNILIEFDGKHHFEPIRYGGQTIEDAEYQTKRTKFYDGIKTANAFLAGIRMIRISYYDRDNISNILDKELFIKE
jgi:hypothetical protein